MEDATKSTREPVEKAKGGVVMAKDDARYRRTAMQRLAIGGGALCPAPF
jgi:hypothetical protein